MERIPMTVSGYEKMKEELKHLKAVERPNVIAAISSARELGDLSENAEYSTAKEKQSMIEGRILELDDKLARVEVIDMSKLSGKKITFGAHVRIIDEDTEVESYYQIVGEYESDLSKNLLSLNSPLARALIGKAAGDSVEVDTPGGKRSYEILAVEFK